MVQQARQLHVEYSKLYTGAWFKIPGALLMTNSASSELNRVDCMTYPWRGGEKGSIPGSAGAAVAGIGRMQVMKVTWAQTLVGRGVYS